jgi:hypothetical protein
MGEPRLAPLIIGPLLFVGLAHSECTTKSIAELQYMTQRELVLEMCSALAQSKIDGDTADRLSRIGDYAGAESRGQDSTNCAHYGLTISLVLRKDHKVTSDSAFKKGMDEGFTPCIDEARARGFFSDEPEKKKGTNGTAKKKDGSKS